MTHSTPIDATSLLSDTQFLRRLATKLVGSADADDVAQDVLIAANSGTAPADVDRRWLSGVTRKVAAYKQRTELRRQRREHFAARRDEVASAGELVQRAEMQRVLADAVNSLPESLRDVVVLRFFEDQPPRDVAKQLGIPVNTVRSRTQRALEQLRGRLDATHGDRKSWVGALLPLALPEAAVLFSVGKVLRVAAAALVVLGLSVGGYYAFRGGAAPLPNFEQRGEVTSVLGETAERDDAEPGRASVVPTPVDAVLEGVRGRVVDTEGQPVAGAVVYYGSKDWQETFRKIDPPLARLRETKTDESGAFRLPTMEQARIAFHGGKIEIGEPLHEDYYAFHEATHWAEDEEPVIVMRRLVPARLEVELVDEAGTAVPMFRVSAWNSWKSEMDPNGRRSRMTVREERGSAGVFAREIRCVEGERLFVSVYCPGHGNSGFGPKASVGSQVLRHEFEVTPNAELRVRFDVDMQAAERVAKRTTSGRVIDAATREPVAGAELVMRTDGWFEEAKQVRRNQTRADGTFRIARPQDREAGTLTVTHPEYDTVEVSAASDEIEPIELARRGSIACTVVDRDGRPIADMPYLFRTRSGDVHERGRTDEEGRIEFRGLLSGRYHVFLLQGDLDPDEKAIESASFAVEAGVDLDERIVVDDLNTFPVHGIVIAPFVAPIVPVFVPVDGDGGWVTAKPRGHGNFDAGGMRAGRYVPLLVPADDADRETPITVLPPIEIDGFSARGLELRWPTGSVRGRLELPSGFDTNGVTVVAVPDWSGDGGVAGSLFASARFAEQLGVAVDADGAFTLPNLAAGSWTLQLRRGAEVVATRPVQCEDEVNVGTWVVQ